MHFFFNFLLITVYRLCYKNNSCEYEVSFFFPRTVPNRKGPRNTQFRPNKLEISGASDCPVSDFEREKAALEGHKPR